MEFSISLKDTGYSRIFVDDYWDEEDKVWMSVFGRRGSMAVVMDKGVAEQLIEALQQILAKEKTA